MFSLKTYQRTRTLALEILEMIEQEKEIPASEIFSSCLEKSLLEERDRSLTKEIVYGVLRHRLLLDYAIRHHARLKRPPQPILQQILRIACYQILFLTRVPTYAAVNEAVQDAHAMVDRGAAGFVNAVLRKIAGLSLKNIPWPDSQKDPARFLSIRYSHPLWMVKRLSKQYGPIKTEALLKMNNEPAPLVLRVNTMKSTREEIMKWIRSHHPEARTEPGRYSPQALSLGKFTVKKDWPPLEQGWVYIQDEGAQLIGFLAQPKEGTRIVDFCSAPGGKITHVAELVENRAELIALDKSKKRLQKVWENCQRLGIREIRIEQISEDVLDRIQRNPADLVLVDVPCSGLGIIRRQPDLKWKKTQKSLDRLPEKQLEILGKAAKLVREGGTILYSTCTLLKEENEDVIRKFIETHSEFKVVKIGDSSHRIDPSLITDEGFFLSFPPDTQTDGFFGALLIKSPSYSPNEAFHSIPDSRSRSNRG